MPIRNVRRFGVGVQGRQGGTFTRRCVLEIRSVVLVMTQYHSTLFNKFVGIFKGLRRQQRGGEVSIVRVKDNEAPPSQLLIGPGLKK